MFSRPDTAADSMLFFVVVSVSSLTVCELTSEDAHRPGRRNISEEEIATAN